MRDCRIVIQYGDPLFLHVKVSERWAESPSHYRTIGLDFDPK